VDTSVAPLYVSHEIEALSDTSFTVLFTLSQPSSAQIEYGKTTAYGNVGPIESSFKYAQHRQKLSGLEPGTTYHWRVIGIANAAGRQGVPSPDQTTRTTGGSSTTAVTTTTSNSAPTTTTMSTTATKAGTSSITLYTTNIYSCREGLLGCRCYVEQRCDNGLVCALVDAHERRCVVPLCTAGDGCQPSTCAAGSLGCACIDDARCNDQLRCATLDSISLCVEPTIVAANALRRVVHTFALLIGVIALCI
jgi:hypothetical protein